MTSLLRVFHLSNVDIVSGTEKSAYAKTKRNERVLYKQQLLQSLTIIDSREENLQYSYLHRWKRTLLWLDIQRHKYCPKADVCPALAQPTILPVLNVSFLLLNRFKVQLESHLLLPRYASHILHPQGQHAMLSLFASQASQLGRTTGCSMRDWMTPSGNVFSGKRLSGQIQIR